MRRATGAGQEVVNDTERWYLYALGYGSPVRRRM